MEDTGRAEERLVGGAASGAESDHVVFLRASRVDGAFNDCSGTLVSPSVVLTAKHCVAHVKNQLFQCTGSGKLIENGTGAGNFGGLVEAKRIEIHLGASPSDRVAARGREIFTTASMDACHDDVAAVVLDTPVALPSYAPLRASTRTVVGQRVRLLGYGDGDQQGIIERTEIDDVRIVDVGSDDAKENPWATTPRRSFVVPGGTACFGDSGGPALAMDTNALVGIYSRITGDCMAAESRNTFMLASSFGELFQRAFEAAGEQPTTEALANGAASSGTPPVAPQGSTDTPAETRSRHEAFHCAVRVAPSERSGSGVAWVAALFAGLALSRRRAARPF